MPKHLPKLLVLVALISVGPLSAHPAGSAESECPYERAAREAAAAGATTVTIDTTVPRGSLLGAGRESHFLP